MGKYIMCSGGWKNADAEFGDVQQAKGPIQSFFSEAKSVRGKHETIMLLTIIQLSVFVFTKQYYLIGVLTWGEAMCSFTHHLQVWMV